MKIVQVIAREVLDSRGRPTVEAEVLLDSGAHGWAIVPSGASTGKAEACELRDGDAERYDGQGVLKAVNHIRNVIAPAVRDMDPTEQAALDARLLELDGTAQKTNLGANALLAVSLANAHAAAAGREMPLFRHLHALFNAALGKTPELSGAGDIPRPAGNLAANSNRLAMPVPMTNMISGGLHAGGKIDFQDFLVMPLGGSSYRQQLEWIVRVYRRLGKRLAEGNYESALVGDEGGYGPRLASAEAALELVVAAIEDAGLTPGGQMAITLDVASTHFYDGSHYRLQHSDRAAWGAAEMIDYLAQLAERFPMVSIEDGLAEEDWSGWTELTARLGGKVWLVGDDLFTTNPARLRQGVEQQAANAVLIKVNQIGTLSETFDTLALARRAGLLPVVSARSGETEDTTIADLAVAAGAPIIKIGSIVRSERLAKYNRLLRIEEELEQSDGWASQS